MEEMAEGKGIPIILQGKENKFQVTFKFEEIVCTDKQSIVNELKPFRNVNVNSATDENKNLLDCKSINIFENHVGKLNEVCSRRSIRSPEYNVRVTENGEFIIQCKMFDNSVTQGRSKNKKDAKHKAAEAMLQVLNEREEARCQQFSAFEESAENFSIPIVKVTENVNVKLSSSDEPLRNHVGKLNESFKNNRKHPTYRFCGTANGEFIMECKICDNTITRGQSKSKKDAKQKAAEAMLLVLNRKKDSMCSIQSSDKPCGTENWKFLNGVKIFDNTYECTIADQPKFKKVEKPKAAEVLLGVLNKSENEVCETDHSEEYKTLENALVRKQPQVEQDLQLKADKAMLTVLYDNDNGKNDKKASMHISKKLTAKNVSNSTLNVTDNDNFRLSSEQFENHIESRDQTYYKYKKKHFSHRVCGKPNGGNVSDELKSSTEQFQNHIEKLNKTFCKSKKHFRRRDCRRIDNDELPTECNIFEDVVTQTQSEIKRDLKPKASDVLLGLLSDSETSRNDREESIRQRHLEFYECAKNYPISNFNVRMNGKCHINSRTENYVKKLKEESGKRSKQPPWYRGGRARNGEFIIECIINNIITRGESRYKRKAYQIAAKEMVKILAGNEKMKSQRSMKSPEYKMRNNQRELLVGLDTDIAMERNDVPSLSASSNQGTILGTNSCRSSDNISSVHFGNYVGKLNEICFKETLKHPSYTTFKIDSGEFIIKCEMFDKTCSHGRATTKKEAKQKAAKAMIQLISKNMWKYQRQGDTKPFQTGKFLGFPSNVCNQANMPSSSTDENDNLLESSIDSFENYVGKLNEMCIKRTCKAPTYIEHVGESSKSTCECKVTNDTVETVTWGRSMLKKDAKQRAAQKMIKILNESFKLEHQSLMTSVTIIDTTDYSEQKPMEELINPIAVKESDWSSLKDMNEQELKMELKDLNIRYTITSVRKIANALRLKTKRTKDYKSLTFVSTGESRLEISLNLLRKAVFGLRILKK